ncbi:hypothetical protein VNO77_44363 [Canavalia gladiata]|uniref:Uncharacterized protein n=1 Tax=Canavalia gladiata TaxID=3824 RepID=A0AAN9PQA6_CANGL
MVEFLDGKYYRNVNCTTFFQSEYLLHLIVFYPTVEEPTRLRRFRHFKAESLPTGQVTFVTMHMPCPPFANRTCHDLTI